jgi:hypothetical protein
MCDWRRGKLRLLSLSSLVVLCMIGGAFVFDVNNLVHKNQFEVSLKYWTAKRVME